MQRGEGLARIIQNKRKIFLQDNHKKKTVVRMHVRTCIFIASTTASCCPASTNWPAITPLRNSYMESLHFWVHGGREETNDKNYWNKGKNFDQKTKKLISVNFHIIFFLTTGYQSSRHRTQKEFRIILYLGQKHVFV